jgi:acetyl esterase/lipase
MSLRAELLRLGFQTLLKNRDADFDVDGLRRSMRRVEWLVPRPPARSRTTVIRMGRLSVHQVTTPASRPDRALLYLHGGGYVSGGPGHYRHFLWRMADALAATVFLPAYRLAPEHPFPAALEDAAEAYLHLAAEASGAQNLFVMGDSAGGGLALALLLKLRDEGRPLPLAAVAMSPWTDLALTGASLRDNAAADPMMNASHLPGIARLYLGGTDPRTPYASPLYGDVTGLPPVLIQVGSDEILRDDAVRMAEKLRAAGGDVKLEEWPRMPHVWHHYARIIPEGRHAIERIGTFVQAMLN